MNKHLPKHEVIGEIEVLPNGALDIGDPCYKRSGEGVYRDMEILPGTYLCEVNRRFNGTVSSMVFRHKVAADGLKLSVLKGQLLKTVGVDSGLMSVCVSPRPDYTRGPAWSDFCRRIGEKEDGDAGTNAWMIGNYFVCNSGYGDGVYGIYGHLNGGMEVYDMVAVRF